MIGSRPPITPDGVDDDRQTRRVICRCQSTKPGRRGDKSGKGRQVSKGPIYLAKRTRYIVRVVQSGQSHLIIRRVYIAFLSLLSSLFVFFFIHMSGVSALALEIDDS